MLSDDNITPIMFALDISKPFTHFWEHNKSLFSFAAQAQRL